ncbi:cation-translocating P-type ATPase [Candidatus Roizmanbacteria bacterium]|nr:cation-translocating P-type ATPase [Candidatus Roizmanbacteria bacterium]
MKDLLVQKTGLSENEVLERQKKYGKNEIKGRETTWYDVLFRQFTSPFVYLLIFASILAIYLGELLDGAMVMLFVIINALLGFYQEFKSEEALKILKRYIIATTKVLRNGEKKIIESINLVPDDIVILEPGDKIPADIRFIETTDLSVDESILTGESAPVKKDINKQNIGSSGTTILTGKAKGIVIRIGKETSVGEIARITVETKHVSSFEKGLTQFSSFIIRLIILTLVFVFVANILINGSNANIVRLAIFSIALAVSVIPEALPVVTTFSLSRGALKLTKNKVVVKRLSAIEDLGGIEILCSDKTGTITENKLTVDNLYAKDSKKLLIYGALASLSNDSFDVAIRKKLSSEEHTEVKQFIILTEIPFDPERKRNSLLVKKNSEYYLVVRGAPEEILTLSNNLSLNELKNLESWIGEQGNKGNRTLAVGMKKVTAAVKDHLTKEENNLEFLGCISFVDPIKPTAYSSIKKAKEMRVGIKILTGDSKEVATAVALQVGLIKNAKEVVTGDEFIDQPVEKQHKIVEEYNVFARTSPQQKYAILKLLEEKHEVGFLGEGINDAPALKIANVALVVDTASDIARDTADIVLLHKSLRVIVDGIKLGRETFSNTTKYIKATLSSNFGNFYTVAIASLFVSYLPLLPLQILLINLLTDFPMISIASDSIDTKELKNPKAYDLKEIALIATILGVVSSFFDFMFFILFSRISPQVLQTNWFIGSVLTELVFLFSIRTKSPVLKALKPSRPVIFLSLLAAIVAVVIPFTQFGHRFFSFISPTPTYLIMIIAIVLLYFISTETVKLVYYGSAFYKKSQS